DNLRLPRGERSQRARYAVIFKALRSAGISRRGMYEAWDFTVASTSSLTSRLLAIRNDAFGQLSDYDLSDGKVQGRAPSFTVTEAHQLAPQVRRVQGTLNVPCYLLSCGSDATAGFYYASAEPDVLPTQIPGNVAAAPFECIIPTSASATHSARLSLYGHGFLGSRAEVEAPWVQEMATAHNMSFCATDWLGQAAADLPFFIGALRNVNGLPNVVDRIQQGVLNTLYLGRLMVSPDGLASNPAFQAAGVP